MEQGEHVLEAGIEQFGDEHILTNINFNINNCMEQYPEEAVDTNFIADNDLELLMQLQ